jgi:DNA polymerase-1
MPKTKRTKTGYTTDADALQSLFDKTAHPFLQHLLTHRDVTRLKVTVDGLLNAAAADGRIHTTFNQTIAATGRLSSTEPNLQNIPIRTDAGRQIRDAFVVGNGYSELMTADYSQIEMRIMAHLSRDDGLIEAFKGKGRPALFVASRAFRVPIEGSPPAAPPRQGDVVWPAYGLSAYGGRSAEDLHRSQGQMDRHLPASVGCAGLMDVVEQARKDGYTLDRGGRRRCHPGWTAAIVRCGGRRAGGAQRADQEQRGRHHRGRQSVWTRRQNGGLGAHAAAGAHELLFKSPR